MCLGWGCWNEATDSLRARRRLVGECRLLGSVSLLVLVLHVISFASSHNILCFSILPNQQPRRTSSTSIPSLIASGQSRWTGITASLSRVIIAPRDQIPAAAHIAAECSTQCKAGINSQCPEPLLPVSEERLEDEKHDTSHISRERDRLVHMAGRSRSI